MHSFAPHRTRRAGAAPAQAPKGLILNGGWRYDLTGWVCDTFLFRGQLRALRRRSATLARLQPGAVVLDIGCGTGTLALDLARRVGRTGRVVGVDPGSEQIAWARLKAARRRRSIEFQVGGIEQLSFPDQTFDVVFATLMLHHLPRPLQRRGLGEIARVLKPGGRLVLADFAPRQERQGRAARFHAGGSSLPALAALVQDAGFVQVSTEELPIPRFSAFPGAGLVRASKSADSGAI